MDRFGFVHRTVTRPTSVLVAAIPIHTVAVPARTLAIHQRSPKESTAVSRRRTCEELSEKERWYCIHGCGKFYRKSSSRSIRKHIESCPAKDSSFRKSGPVNGILHQFQPQRLSMPITHRASSNPSNFRTLKMPTREARPDPWDADQPINLGNRGTIGRPMETKSNLWGKGSLMEEPQQSRRRFQPKLAISQGLTRRHADHNSSRTKSPPRPHISMELQSPTTDQVNETFGPLQEGFRQQLWPPRERSAQFRSLQPHPKMNGHPLPRKEAGDTYPQLPRKKTWMTTEPMRTESMNKKEVPTGQQATIMNRTRPRLYASPNAGTRKGNASPIRYGIPKSLKDRIMREEALFLAAGQLTKMRHERLVNQEEDDHNC